MSASSRKASITVEYTASSNSTLRRTVRPSQVETSVALPSNSFSSRSSVTTCATISLVEPVPGATRLRFSRCLTWNVSRGPCCFWNWESGIVARPHFGRNPGPSMTTPWPLFANSETEAHSVRHWNLRLGLLTSLKSCPRYHWRLLVSMAFVVSSKARLRRACQLGYVVDEETRTVRKSSPMSEGRWRPISGGIGQCTVSP